MARTRARRPTGAGGAIDWSRAGARRPASTATNRPWKAASQRARTLSEHLNDQLAVAGLSEPADRIIAQVLIDGVDEGGYLRPTWPRSPSGWLHAGAGARRADPPAGFEPAGVFARDVRECLRLQLKERDRFDPAMAALLDNLDLLAKRDMRGAAHAPAASTRKTCRR